MVLCRVFSRQPRVFESLIDGQSFISIDHDELLDELFRIVANVAPVSFMELNLAPSGFLGDFIWIAGTERLVTAQQDIGDDSVGEKC